MSRCAICGRQVRGIGATTGLCLTCRGIAAALTAFGVELHDRLVRARADAEARGDHGDADRIGEQLRRLDASAP